jgi:hypothetical protein
MNRKLVGLAGVGAAALLAYTFMPHLAPPAFTGQAIPDNYASQGWSAQDANDWYSLSQGSRLMPLAWVNALQTTSGAPFIARDHMAGYGYSYLDEKAKFPIGFVLDNDAVKGDFLGLNCSACHTSILHTASATIHVHGGQTMADFQSFNSDILEAVTRAKDPGFDAFAAKVLAGDVAPEAKQKLQADLADWIAYRSKIQGTYHNSTTWGRGRADAVGIILATTATLINPDGKDALPASDAPVSYPFIWNTNQQALLQHNGIVQNGPDMGLFGVTKLGSLIRNWTEVLGVFGEFHIDPATQKVTSSVNFKNLMKLEGILAKLNSPRWPDEFGKIDEAKAARGKALYAQSCQSCHALLAPNDMTTMLEVNSKTTSPKPEHYIYLAPLIDSSNVSARIAAGIPANPDLIGTDPLMACNAALHLTPTGIFKGQSRRGLLLEQGKYGEFALTTDTLTTLMQRDVGDRKSEILKAYAQVQIDDAKIQIASYFAPEGYVIQGGDIEVPGNAIDKFRANCADNLMNLTALSGGEPALNYKTRPLNGIWATAPYLHNGSVPTLRDLLNTQSERPKTHGFLDGNFDTAKVGHLDQSTEPKAFVFRVYDDKGEAILGNWNGGHEYGVNLRDTEKDDLVEYLKGL